MTHPLRGTPRASAAPASQNTAPVLEFRCLFSHDIRRKAKRWQDGYLKFHTFNNRVMVFDASRFSVGETYYKDSNELQDGDELTLDRGILVTVAEAMGTTHTDLTPLFERKAVDSPKGTSAATSHRPLPTPRLPARNLLQTGSQTRHKSLSALLGTPRGPVGKAVAIISPFEQRMEKERNKAKEKERDKENQHPDERATKRLKTVHETQFQQPQQPSRPSAAKQFTSKKVSLEVPRLIHSRPPAMNSRPPTRTVPTGSTIITLDSSADDGPPELELPSSPLRPASLMSPSSTRSRDVTRSDHASPPNTKTFATPRLPKGKVPVPSVKAQQHHTPPPRIGSPPISVSNKITNVDFAMQTSPCITKETRSGREKEASTTEPPAKRKTTSLRLSTGVKRGMLLCQPLPSRQQTKELRLKLPTVQAAEGAEDEMELVHGSMDAQLRVSPKDAPPVLVVSSPPNVHASPTTELPKATVENKIVQEAERAASGPKKKKAKSTKLELEKVRPQTKQKAADIVIIQSRSPSPVFFPDDDDFMLTGELASIPAPANVRPRVAAIPVSAKTFMKDKPSNNSKCSKRKSKSPPESRATNTTSRHHPLRSSDHDAMMSNAEVSTLLKRGPKSMHLADDPIEDASQKPQTSPSRSLKRSRSENDAPIPSTSEAWEQRNLANGSDLGSKPSNAEGPAQQSATAAQPPRSGLAALVKKTDPRRKFLRTQSLGGDNTDVLAEPSEVVVPPVDTDIGPWSTEAFDLFDWRPPSGTGIGLLVDKQ